MNEVDTSKSEARRFRNCLDSGYAKAACDFDFYVEMELRKMERRADLSAKCKTADEMRVRIKCWLKAGLI